MPKRKATAYIKNWMDIKDKKCLVVQGARQTGKTLIFLDEIQECQEAITSLKFWAIDNRYDVVASGSLLGID